MKKGLAQIIGLLLLALVIVAAIGLAVSSRPRGNSQEDLVAGLRDRLTQQGVPVKDVRVVTQSPLQIEIILQISGSEDRLTKEDVWHTFLTEREADLTYLNLGVRLDSHEIVILNSKGEEVSRGTAYLNPDIPSQRLSPLPKATIGDNETKELLSENLNLNGMEVLSIQIRSDPTFFGNGKVVELDLSIDAPSVEVANSRTDFLVPNLLMQLEEFNRQYAGAQIIIVIINIKDQNGNILMEYLDDFERQSQTFWGANGIEASWWPRPAIDLRSPTPTPTAVYPPPAAFPYP